MKKRTPHDALDNMLDDVRKWELRFVYGKDAVVI